MLGAGALGTAIYSQLILNGAERLYIFNDSETLADQAKNDAAMIARKTGVEIQLFDASNRVALKQLRYVLRHRELRVNNWIYKIIPVASSEATGISIAVASRFERPTSLFPCERFLLSSA